MQSLERGAWPSRCSAAPALGGNIGEPGDQHRRHPADRRSGARSAGGCGHLFLMGTPAERLS
jgi:hypothetical protein